MSENPYRPPQARGEIQFPADPLVFGGTPASRNQGPAGLGGWLIFVAIGLVVTPLKLVSLLLTTFLPLFKDGTVQALTTPGSEHYHPLWRALIAYEVFGNGLFALAFLGLAILFFSKSRRFPKLYMAPLLTNLVFLIGDEIMGSQIPALASSDNFDSMKEIVRTMIACCIWVPYMMVSKRVKNTFV